MPRESEKNRIISYMCTNQIVDMMLADTSDEAEQEDADELFITSMLSVLLNRRSVHLGVPKSADWHQQVLKNFDDSRFNQMVRVQPAEFVYILDLIKEADVFKTSANSYQLPIDLQLQIVLYRLGSTGDGLSIRKIASLFGIGDGGTIQNVTRRVFKAILSVKSRFMNWPSAAERLQIVSATRNEMPGCIGYIDGSEIKLAEAPVKNHQLYFSRKRQYSIKMQAICHYKLRIRQLTIGYPGSVHDAKIFMDCPLSKYPERFLDTSQWIAGDSAYPLKPFLITPFRQNSNEYTRETRELFNKHFSKYRVRIENCFGLVKEKFGSLKELKFRLLTDQNKEECNDWIMVCCILHNILIEYKERQCGHHILASEYNIPPPSNTRAALLNFIQNQTQH